MKKLGSAFLLFALVCGAAPERQKISPDARASESTTTVTVIIQ